VSSYLLARKLQLEDDDTIWIRSEHLNNNVITFFLGVSTHTLFDFLLPFVLSYFSCVLSVFMVYHHIQSLKALEMRIFYHIFYDFSNLYLTSIEAWRAHDFAGNRSKNNFRNSESHSKPVQVDWSATWPQLTWTSFLLQGPTRF
jgi:hypothetical protein